MPHFTSLLDKGNENFKYLVFPRVEIEVTTVMLTVAAIAANVRMKQNVFEAISKNSINLNSPFAQFQLSMSSFFVSLIDT